MIRNWLTFAGWFATKERRLGALFGALAITIG